MTLGLGGNILELYAVKVSRTIIPKKKKKKKKNVVAYLNLYSCFRYATLLKVDVYTFQRYFRGCKILKCVT